MAHESLICPKCKNTMNHHADKVDYGTPSAGKDESIFGGTVEQIHTCPECGYTEARAETVDPFVSTPIK